MSKSTKSPSRRKRIQRSGPPAERRSATRPGAEVWPPMAAEPSPMPTLPSAAAPELPGLEPPRVTIGKPAVCR